MSACAACGRDNPADAQFCSACGARLSSGEAPGERKVVTVLFVDVTGSTELADRLDVEDLRDVMSAWFAAVREEIDVRGGVVEKYIGDAVLAVFGVPSAHEDDPSRALRAALAIRQRLVEVNERLQAAYGVTMQVRTGINTGQAVATLSPAPGEAIVTGVAVNAAARLEQLAQPGQTVVAERTARAAPGFQFEELGLQELRGTSEAVRAFLLIDETPDAETRGIPGLHAPLVGRSGELDLLLTLYERALAERRPHLVTLYGDPGVGKSRLVHELLDRLAALEEAPRIVVGRCLSYGAGITYWPLAEILRSLAGISDDDNVGAALDRIDGLTASAFDGSSVEAHGLATAALAFTLGLDAGNDVFNRLHPTALRVELHRAWRGLLSHVADRDRLVVVVDDIHWADPVLLDLLEELAERCQGALLLVCPARPELSDRRPTWGGGKRSFSSVHLSPLTEHAAMDLVAHLLDVDGLSDESRAQILGRAEGNPFFLEEILRQLIDERRIVSENGRWKATAGRAQLALPDTVQGVLAARIDLLAPRQKRTLQQASVVGRTFWRGAVAALLDDGPDPDDDLRSLEGRELVTSRLGSSLIGEEEYAFRHILTRDVAYETLPRRDRPHAHAAVARWIETTAGDRQQEYSSLLAHHYLEAFRGAVRDRSFPADEREALRRRAFALVLLASRNALRATAFEAARSLSEAALEAAATGDERATALESMGEACRNAALGDGAWTAYTGAVDALREAGSDDHQRIGRLTGLALETAVRWSGTMETLPPEEVALGYLRASLAELADGDDEAHVRLLTAQAFWRHGYPRTVDADQDPVRAETVGRAASDMALRIDRPDLAVVALDAVSHNLQRQLRYVESAGTAWRRLELARTAGDMTELGDSFAVVAWDSAFLGDFVQARDSGREGYDLLASDAPLYATHALSWSTYARFYLGDWTGVLEGLDLVVAGLGKRAGVLTSGFSSPWPCAAFVHEARGDSAMADELLEQLQVVERGRGSVSAGLTPTLVSLSLLRGQTTAARERFDDAIRRDANPANLPFLVVAEAELLRHEGRASEFDALVARMRAVHAISGARYLPPAADLLSAHACLARDDVEAAVALFESAVAGYDAQGMAVDAASARLDAAEAMLARGQSVRARELASAASEALTRAGFEREMRRAASLLTQL